MNDWKEVTWIEAANAFAAKTHEAAARIERNGDYQRTVNFSPDPLRTYRIREKARTITVTIPRPCSCGVDIYGHAVLTYANTKDADTAGECFLAAMEQQP